VTSLANKRLHKQKHDWLGCTLFNWVSWVQLSSAELCRYKHPLMFCCNPAHRQTRKQTNERTTDNPQQSHNSALVWVKAGRGGHLCRVADNTVWSHWQVASRSNVVLRWISRRNIRSFYLVTTIVRSIIMVFVGKKNYNNSFEFIEFVHKISKKYSFCRALCSFSRHPDKILIWNERIINYLTHYSASHLDRRIMRSQ